MQVILNEIVEGNFVVFVRKCGNFLCVKFLMFWPLAGIHCAEFIAQITKRGVRDEPMFILCKKLFVFFRLKRSGLLRWENLFQKVEFRLHHRFVIHCIKGVESLAQWLKFFQQRFIFWIRDGSEV